MNGMFKRITKFGSGIILAAIFSWPAFADDTNNSAAFTIKSTSTSDQGVFPVLYTCDGKDISPELEWIGQPAKLAAYALIVTDPDAPGGTFYHWILYNVPKDSVKLAEGMTKPPAGTLVGKNSFGNQQYNGPCPPKGSTHSYVFTLYALDNKLSIPAGADGSSVLAEVGKHTLGKATFTVTYSRWNG